MEPIYKTKNGIKYIYWLDYPSKILAQCQVDNFNRDGVKAFVEAYKGYYRVFVELLKEEYTQ